MNTKYKFHRLKITYHWFERWFYGKTKQAILVGKSSEVRSVLSSVQRGYRSWIHLFLIIYILPGKKTVISFILETFNRR